MPGQHEFSAGEEQRMRKGSNEGIGTFVYDDVGNRLGQGQMSPRPRERKGTRVGPFPKTTTGFDATKDQN